MKLRTKYLLFVSILHLLTLGLSYVVFRDNKILFIASEIVILLSALLAWQLYVQLIRPLQTLMRGVDAIKNQDFNIKFVHTGKPEMDQLIDVYNRMIDQLREERTRQEEQHFFLEKLIYTSPVGIVVLDHNGKIEQLNPKAIELTALNKQKVVGMFISDIENPFMQQARRLNSGESSLITVNGLSTYRVRKAHFIDRGFPRHFLMIEELTAEILAAEKKAYGKVIRMMAHEVNNTIGPVNSILQSVLTAEQLMMAENSRYHNALQVAIDRNHNLNLFMRNFADVVRLPTPVKKHFELNKVIASVIELVRLRWQEKNITFSHIQGNEPFLVHADQQQMEQVLLNVTKNAAEAITSNGLITFSTCQNPRRLVVTDNGTGIPEEISEQLFSPFFSTKRDGQGIGLTLVKEIILNHGFDLSLKTTAPGNTEFVIYFE